MILGFLVGLTAALASLTWVVYRIDYDLREDLAPWWIRWSLPRRPFQNG